MPKRIVIADDEAILRMDLRDVLERQGYMVVGEASNGLQAVNRARDTRPDLVIMDIRMPEMDGLTAARILDEEKIAPVLLLTAFGDKPFVEQAKEAHVVNYVIKPLQESEVVASIEIALTRYRELRQLETQSSVLLEQFSNRTKVERAKSLLMKIHGLGERDAYRKIQKTSMDYRKPMYQVADAILIAHELETC